jgi:hypothetical protein
MAKNKDKGLKHIAARNALAERKRFLNADNERRSGSETLLGADDVAGEYDFSRRLMTTLGGEARLITIEDLRQFSHITKQQTAKFRKGITAKGIIDFSLPVDRERANDEIKTAIPIAHQKGQIRFMTNSGPNSDRQRHYVIVDLVNWNPVLAGSIKIEKTGYELSKSPLRISCTCGRWRYWLAFLATKGNYNSGLEEHAFPKIRNPGLSGIACKHILRVVGMIHQSPYIKQYMTNMVKKAREKIEVDAKLNYEKIADSRAAEEKLKNESWRQRKILTSEEKRAKRQSAKARKEMAEKMKEVGVTHKKIKLPSKKTLRVNERATQFKRSGISRAGVESLFDSGAIDLPKGTTKAEFLSAFDAAR